MSTLPNVFFSNVGSVADGNLSQAAEACLRLIDLLQEIPVDACCLGCQLHSNTKLNTYEC
jgi:hypothetical protein